MTEGKKSFVRRYPIIAGVLLLAAITLLGCVAYGVYGAVWETSRKAVASDPLVKFESDTAIPAPITRQFGCAFFGSEPGPLLTRVSLTPECDHAKVIRSLTLFPELISLSITRGNITETDARFITRLSNLVSLTLTNCEVAPDAREILAPWLASRGVVCYLSGASASDEMLVSMMKHKVEVHSVRPYGGRLTEIGFAALASSPHRIAFDGRMRVLTPNDWKMLADMKMLAYVKYRPEDICNEAIGVIVNSHWSEPSSMHLTDDKFTDAALAGFRRNKVCAKLMVEGKRFTSAGLDELGQAPMLQSLALKGLEIPAGGFAGLAKSQSIQHLFIDGGSVAPKAWADLRGLTGLVSLDVKNVAIAPEAFIELATALDGRPRMTLWLSGTGLRDEGLLACARVANLCELRIREPEITDSGLVAFKNHPVLEILDLGKGDITPQGVAALGELPRLRRLALKRNAIDPASIQWSFRQPNLEVLILWQIHVADGDRTKPPTVGYVSIPLLMVEEGLGSKLGLNMFLDTDRQQPVVDPTLRGRISFGPLSGTGPRPSRMGMPGTVGMPGMAGMPSGASAGFGVAMPALSGDNDDE